MVRGRAARRERAERVRLTGAIETVRISISSSLMRRLDWRPGIRVEAQMWRVGEERVLRLCKQTGFGAVIHRGSGNVGIINLPVWVGVDPLIRYNAPFDISHGDLMFRFLTAKRDLLPKRPRKPLLALPPPEAPNVEPGLPAILAAPQRYRASRQSRRRKAAN